MATLSAERINIPDGSATVEVSCIDSARLLDLPWNLFIGPPLAGITGWNCSGYSFLITHIDEAGSKRRVLFDLSPAKDWEQILPPPMLSLLGGWQKNGARIIVKDQIHDILKREGVELNHNDTLVWSHPHWDHIGNPSLFPLEVPLLVGPDVVSEMGPGYPEKEHATWYTKDLKGREMREVSFAKPDTIIGGMEAIDFFSDGSFYLLNAPGHCVGHMNALARVGEDSFIFIGADSYHHPSQIRPNAGNPLPPTLDIKGLPDYLPTPCPCDAFQPLYDNIEEHSQDKHYHKFSEQTKPGYTPMLTAGWIKQHGKDYCLALSPTNFIETIEKIQSFDCDDRIFCISSHDIALADVLKFFPSNINDWKTEGWKEQAKWNHLADFSPFLSKYRSSHT